MYMCVYIYIIQFICILESQVVECSMGSFYTQRFQKLICLHLPTDCFVEISPHSTGHIAWVLVEWGEISTKQSVGKCKQINF